MADSHPGSGGITLKPLIQSQAAAPSPAPPPLYPMTYSDQVAQSLGVRDGGVELRSADRSNPYAPSLRFTGGMLRLQWRP